MSEAIKKTTSQSEQAKAQPALADKKVTEISKDIKDSPAFTRMRVAVKSQDKAVVKAMANEMLDQYRGTPDFNEAQSAVHSLVREMIASEKKQDKLGKPSIFELFAESAEKSDDRGIGFAAFGMPQAA